MSTLPPEGSVWQRKGRARRVIGALNNRVCYSNGGNRNRWCDARTWRRWARLAEIVAQEDERTLVLEG